MRTVEDEMADAPLTADARAYVASPYHPNTLRFRRTRPIAICVLADLLTGRGHVWHVPASASLRAGAP